MNEYSLSLNKRLALIDHYLMFRGKIGRGELIRHFDVGIATASRTLKEYRELYPRNLDYSVSDRSYVISEGFAPAFEHDIEKALALMAYGLDIREIAGARFGQSIPPIFSPNLSPSTISGLTRAMVAKQGLEVLYASGSSDVKVRKIAPHTLFQGGGAWYVRAFDGNRNEFRTFRCSRIREIAKVFDCKERWSAIYDKEWQKSVALTLGPHPKRENQEALREDLGLVDKPVRNIVANEVTAGFALIDLRVDCSLDGSLNPYEYHLRLMNRHELLSVGSLAIAPGFTFSEALTDSMNILS